MLSHGPSVLSSTALTQVVHFGDSTNLSMSKESKFDNLSIKVLGAGRGVRFD